MRENREAMMVVRAELSDRLDRLRRLSTHPAGPDFGRGVQDIRLLALAYGLGPVARLAEALERPGSGSIDLYMERLRDAIGCERVDDDAAQAMLASVSVRFTA
jgi:hypothetical protein